jgi:putative ABC transport system permease protein
LLSKDFLKLVLIAFSLAVPLIYLGLNRWLEDFAYHVDLQATDFILTGSVVLLVAFLTVSYQSIKTAVANPVDALRYE